MAGKRPRQRVLDMVASGQISPEEGDRLLSSMDKEKRKSIWTWLFNPLEGFGTAGALALGALVSGASLVLGRLADVRFDGVFDIHVPFKISFEGLAGEMMGEQSGGAAFEVNWIQAALDQLVSWPLFAVVAWLLAVAFVKQGRFVDFLAATGAARAPMLVAAVLTRAFFPALVSEGAKFTDVALELAVLGFATIPFVIWFVVAAYRGFKTAAGSAGWKVVVPFVIAIITTEIIGKILLYVFV